MQRAKRLIIAIIIVICVVSVIMFVPFEDGEYIWNPFDYARITEVDYRAVVVDEPGSNGKIVVTERLTFEINAFSEHNLFWELWRDLCEMYIDGVKVEYQVNSVKQIFDDGRAPLVFTEAPKLYWYDNDFINTVGGLGPGKWFHSKGPYNEDKRQYECVLFYVNGIYRETVVFEIEYEMYNASLRWADSSELYISLFSESDVNHLVSFTAQILFPEENMPRGGNYYANTYGTNAHSFPFEESTTINPGYHTFFFELDESQLNFRKYNEYIEFALVSFGEDKHIFTQHASENKYYNYNALNELRQEQAEYEALPGKFRTIKALTLLLFSAGAALTIILVFSADKKTRKKYVFYQPAMQMEYFRDIPSDLDPSVAADLIFCKHKSNQDIQAGYAAVMLSLASKGYIELAKINIRRAWNFGNVKIVIKNEPIHPEQTETRKLLTRTEELYFDLLLRHVDRLGKAEMSLNTFQQKISADYEHTNSFVKNIKNAITTSGLSRGYFQKADYRKLKNQAKERSVTLGIIGGLILIVGNALSYQTRLDLAFGAFFVLGGGFIAGAVILNSFSKKYVLLTQLGEDEYAKWRGLYNFLNSETLMKERSVVELPLWEDYLIYATAFGISEKVISALEIRCKNANESPVLQRNSYYRTRSFRARTGHHSFKSATRSAAHKARISSHSGFGGHGGFGGFGGHGGYGGGGRGGGGGGGGH